MPAKLRHSCLFAQHSCLANLVLVDLLFQFCGILVAIQKEVDVPLGSKYLLISHRTSVALNYKAIDFIISNSLSHSVWRLCEKQVKMF